VKGKNHLPGKRSLFSDRRIVNWAGQAGGRCRLFGVPFLGRTVCAGSLGAARRETVSTTQTTSGEPVPSGRFVPGSRIFGFGADANGRFGNRGTVVAAFGMLRRSPGGRWKREDGRRIGGSPTRRRPSGRRRDHLDSFGGKGGKGRQVLPLRWWTGAVQGRDGVSIPGHSPAGNLRRSRKPAKVRLRTGDGGR
jgi:hypothetical protein